MKFLAVALIIFASGYTVADTHSQQSLLQNKSDKLKHFKKKLVIPDAMERKLESHYVDETFSIYILLPENYDAKKEGGYPVFYLLDADYFVHSLDHATSFNSMLPDTIIVGIGYEGADSDGTKRIRDYSPTTVVEYPNSGGAGNFRAMLLNELKPRINQNLNVNTEHETLVSWSLSGLFALDTLFNHQALFDNYIVASPYLAWDNYMIFNEEAKYAYSNTDLNTKLFLSVGELESVETTKAPFYAFVNTIEARSYTNLLIEDREIEGEAHNTMVAPSFNKGLRHVFSDIKALNLPEEVLKDYIGTYDFFPGVAMSVQLKDDMLVAQITGFNSFEMYPQQTNLFFSKMIPGLTVEFTRDEDGYINRVTYDSPTLGVFSGTKR
ncbi:alpha/beta hydrolase-fold protein [Alteromonas ponticola]|uniref:Alpha/beta hydrolase-fold protein n=1 Tax=Alteromonas aquimaris TaxID=2998417 RepID=A0ABT3P584_9ALTE|nr:alpha/beta hydrolase-fold protein [Alteromonas aquimaris]MCW8107933.1 alpha/beta hydrolase-fold protein [Alteromonas aquimaris]